MGSSNTDQIQDYSQCNLIELTSPSWLPANTPSISPAEKRVLRDERSSGTNDHVQYYNATK